MKLAQTIPALMLGLAATVTAGSVYVTVQAAAQQDSGTIPAPVVADEANQPAAGNPLEVIAIGSEQPAESVLSNRNHYLMIDENGAFTGRLLTQNSSGTSAAAGLTVKLIKDGAVIAMTSTSAEGTFSVDGLPEGVIALLAYGTDQFMLYAVNLKRVDHFQTPPAIQDVGLISIAPSGADAKLARELVLSSAEGSGSRFQGSSSESDNAYPEGDEGIPSSSISNQDVQLNADGSLVGQANLLDPRTGRHRGVQDLTLHFLQNGSVVGSAQVSPSGEFRMDGLQPGVHSVVSTGGDGVLAIGINIVGTDLVQSSNSKYRLTSIAQTLDLAVAPVSYENFNPDFLNDGDTPPGDGAIAALPPMGPGGFGPGGIGSGGGAGGGFGGGGGFGALLGAAAGAGLGYALGNDDNDAAISPSR